MSREWLEGFDDWSDNPCISTGAARVAGVGAGYIYNNSELSGASFLRNHTTATHSGWYEKFYFRVRRHMNYAGCGYPAPWENASQAGLRVWGAGNYYEGLDEGLVFDITPWGTARFGIRGNGGYTSFLGNLPGKFWTGENCAYPGCNSPTTHVAHGVVDTITYGIDGISLNGEWAYVLDKWHCVEIYVKGGVQTTGPVFCRMGPDGYGGLTPVNHTLAVSDAEVRLRIDGQNVMRWTALGYMPPDGKFWPASGGWYNIWGCGNNPSHSTGLVGFWSLTSNQFVPTRSVIGPATNGLQSRERAIDLYNNQWAGADYGHGNAWFEVDDWISDDATWVGDSGVLLLHPNANGTFTEWTNADYLEMMVPPIGNRSPNITATSPGSKRISFALDMTPLAGCTAVSVSLRCSTYGGFYGFSDSLSQFLIVNGGAPNYFDNQLNGNHNTRVLENAFAATDTVEIGVRNDAATNTQTLYTLYAKVEYTGVATAVEFPDIGKRDLRVKVGTYVGNNAQRHIACGFKPDWVWIFNYRFTGGLWHTALGYHQGGMRGTEAQMEQYSIRGIDATGFLLGGGQNVNYSGDTFYYIAVADQDEQAICSRSMMVSRDGNNPVTSIVTPLNRTFDAEWGLFAYNRVYNYNGIGHLLWDRFWAAPWSKWLNGYGAANTAVIAVTPTTVTFGADFQWVDEVVGLLVNSRNYRSKRLLEVVSWVGDGNASRTISLSSAFAGTPEIVLVSNHAANHSGGYGDPSYYSYNCWWAPGLANSYYMGSGNSFQHGVTGVVTRGFTIGADLNRNGETFVALCAVSGRDVGDIFVRTLGHTGGQAIRLGDDLAPVPDLIPSMGANEYEVGAVPTKLAALAHTFAAFRSSAPYSSVVTYVGDGNASRDIPLNHGIRSTPKFVLGIPHAAATRYYRTHLETLAASKALNSGADSNDAVVAIGDNLVTVGSALNANGVTYSLLSLSEGAVPGPEATFDAQDYFGLLTWIEWTHIDATGTPKTYVFSKIPLPDPSDYYGGWKECRVMKWGKFRRALSDRKGQYETASLTWTLADTDRRLRTMLADPLMRYFQNRTVALRMISDEGRRAKETPRLIARGVIRNYKPLSPLHMEFQAEDFLASQFSSMAFDKQIPQRLISRTDFSDCPKDSIDKPVPFIYGQCSDEPSVYGPVTGLSAAAKAFNYKPTTLALVANTAGTLTGGLAYNVRVSAVGSDGKEYDLGDQASLALVGGANVYDAAIIPPENHATHHRGGAGNANQMLSYRWWASSGLKFIDGVWHESALSNWGDTHGNDCQVGQPGYPLAGEAMIKAKDTYDRIRTYVFNVNDFSAMGFDPTRNPNPPIGVAGDSVRVVRVIEMDAATPYTIQSAKTGGRADAECGGSAEFSHWGDVRTSYDVTHFMDCFGDDDGDDLTATGASNGSIDMTWDAWTPPAGVTLSGYRVYWNAGGDWRWFASATASATLSSMTQGSVVWGQINFYAVTAMCSDGETVLSTDVTGASGAKATLPSIIVSWQPLQQAKSYYVYRRSGGGTYDRRWLIAASKSSFEDDLLDTGVEMITGYRKPKGLIPLTYVGTMTYNGAKWHRFLIAGHAITSVIAVYQQVASDEFAGVAAARAVSTQAGIDALEKKITDCSDTATVDYIADGPTRDAQKTAWRAEIDGTKTAMSAASTEASAADTAQAGTFRKVTDFGPGNTQFGVDFLAPGKSGWATYVGVATPYEDLNGRRYTCVYARGPCGDSAADGSRPLAINAQGIEDVGDGSGALITDLIDQYQHLLTNWALQSYLTGAWLAAPTWPADVNGTVLSQLDTASFTKVKTNIATVRLSTGYLGAFAYGCKGVQVRMRDLLATLNICADVESGFNRNSQFFITNLDTSVDWITSGGVRKYSQALQIKANSFSIEDKVDDLFNKLPYKYRKHYFDDNYLIEGSMSDDQSILNYKETRADSEVLLDCVRDLPTAFDVLSRRLLRTSEPPRYVQFTVNLSGLSSELGDVIKVDHTDGIGPVGWTDHPLRILRHEFDPDNLSIWFETVDIYRELYESFRLGDDTWGSDEREWATASNVHRALNGYLCDETTGKFGTDYANGKRLR